jgi:hypothetical protein
MRAHGSVVSWGTMLQVGRLRVRSPISSLDFSIYLIFRATLWPYGSIQHVTEMSTWNLARVKGSLRVKLKPCLHLWTDCLERRSCTSNTRTPGVMQRHLRGYAKSSYRVCKIEKKNCFVGVSHRRTGYKDIWFGSPISLSHILLLCWNTFVPLLIFVWYLIYYFGCYLIYFRYTLYTVSSIRKSWH